MDMHAMKTVAPPFHLKQLIHFRLNEIRNMIWILDQEKNAIKYIIGSNWQNLNMDFDTRLLSNPM